MELKITLSRTTLQPAPDSAHALGASGGMRSDAQLIAGTLHDDALLVCLRAESKAVGAGQKLPNMKSAQFSKRLSHPETGMRSNTSVHEQCAAPHSSCKLTDLDPRCRSMKRWC